MEKGGFVGGKMDVRGKPGEKMDMRSRGKVKKVKEREKM